MMGFEVILFLYIFSFVFVFVSEWGYLTPVLFISSCMLNFTFMFQTLDIKKAEEKMFYSLIDKNSYMLKNNTNLEEFLEYKKSGVDGIEKYLYTNNPYILKDKSYKEQVLKFLKKEGK